MNGSGGLQKSRRAPTHSFLLVLSSLAGLIRRENPPLGGASRQPPPPRDGQRHAVEGRGGQRLSQEYVLWHSVNLLEATEARISHRLSVSQVTALGVVASPQSPTPLPGAHYSACKQRPWRQTSSVGCPLCLLAGSAALGKTLNLLKT